MSVPLMKFDSFIEAAMEKKHNLGSDSLKIALTNTAPSASNSVLADITEISYTNLPTSRVATITSSAQTAGVYKLVLADMTLVATGTVATFRYVVLYNDTATNDELICYWDYGSGITLVNTQNFILDFDDTNGALTAS